MGLRVQPLTRKVEEMSKLTTFLLLISFVALSNGVKFSKKKYKRSGILEAQAKLKELKPLLAQAKADVAQIQACAALAPNDPTRDEVCPEVEDRTIITNQQRHGEPDNVPQ